MTCFFIIVSFLIFLLFTPLLCSYFKPTPRWDEETCTLHLPKSSPLQTFTSKDDAKYPKQSACLEACKQLHKYGALTDNLVPDMVAEEAVAQGNGIYSLSIFNFSCLNNSIGYNSPISTNFVTNCSGNRSIVVDKQPVYVPPEFVHCCPDKSSVMYHCYLIELKQNFKYDTSVHNIVLAMRTELESEIQSMCYDLDTDRGSFDVNFKYVGIIKLSPEQVASFIFQAFDSFRHSQIN